MFVVIEFNQASHAPSVYGTDIYYSHSEATEAAEAAREALVASGSGRRERYAVAELTLLDEY